VAAAEHSSEHPLGQAIVRGTAERAIKMAEVSDFDSVTGQGVRATVEGRRVLVGKAGLLAEAGIDPGALQPAADRLAAEGKSAMFAAVDDEPAGVVAVADTVKQDSPATVAELQRLGIEVVMITGDNPRTAVPPEPVLGLRLQHRGDPAGGRSPLSRDRLAAQPDHRRRGDGGSSLSVVGNANRLHRFTPKTIPAARSRAVEVSVETAAP
jgi:hypothetical protein